MRRVPLFLLTLLPFTTMASAQTAVPVDPVRGNIIATVNLISPTNPELVVARLMTFDRNKDGRVTQSELPERMHSVLSGDGSGDGALDRNEIMTAAMRGSTAAVAAGAATVPGSRAFGGGGYTFGDQVSLSTRSHVEGVLDDLRLPAATRARAHTIITPFMDRLEADASAALMQELEGLMSQRQLGSFKAMLDRQMSGRHVPHITRADGAKVAIFRMGPDLVHMINGFGLPVDHTKAALAALEAFKARIRPGDADRTVLLAELKAVLSDEEREDFGAALQRRPLVKAPGFAGVVGGVVGGQNVIEGGVVTGVVERPAVFRLTSPPQRLVEP
jgi:hypothetical protein